CAPARSSTRWNRRSRRWKTSPTPTPDTTAMSLALVHSRARAGVHAPPVRVEVHLSGGLPSTQIVGLPEAAVRESRDRVRAAILCAQFEYPARRITINL